LCRHRHGVFTGEAGLTDSADVIYEMFAFTGGGDLGVHPPAG
jgi:hypothetical protein